MKSAQKALIIIMIAILSEMFIIGCTPGRSNTRQYGNKNGAKNERIDEDQNSEENFDTEDDIAEPNVESSSQKVVNDNDSDYEEKNYSSLEREKFYQTGIASWYGREFNGKETASGERFDMNKFTAAHRSLPFGSFLEVKNLNTGKSVRVTINDRGPYKGNRILDLSYGAAKKLEIIREGKAFVGIKVIRRGNGEYSDNEYKNRGNIEPVSDDMSNDGNSRSEGIYALQAGAFYSRKNAEELKKKVEGITSRDAKLVHDGNLYKIRIDGVETKKEINRYKRLLSEENISSYLLELKE